MLAVVACRGGVAGGEAEVGPPGPLGSPPPDPGADGGTVNPAPVPAPPDPGPPVVTPPPPDPHKVGGLGAGPWPVAPITVYGSAQGLLERPISASTDEAENLWVVTTRALYLMRPGEGTFRRYTAADGLHVGPGWTEPPDFTFVAGGKGVAAPRPEIPGKRGPIPATIGQAFIGYYAHDTHEPQNPGAHTNVDPIAKLGKMDEVLLKEDMTLIVHRYDFHNSNDWHFYETREIMNAVYDHFHHPGELYVSSNHGVTRVQPENFRDPFTSAEKAFVPGVEKEYYADHVHPWVCDGAPCSSGARSMFGDFFGLLLADDGRIWMGGLTTGAAIHWTPDLQLWRNSWKPDNPFDPAFGDGSGPPIFETRREGDLVNIRAVAETMDGKIWFASGGNAGWRVPWLGLASWEGGTRFQYYDPHKLGALEGNILELVGWEDRLVFGFPNTGLLIWKPGEAKGQRFGIPQGLPGEQIGRLYLDRMTDPPALYVPTEGGLAVLRSLP
ncbi:MAG: hypothetical protein ACJ78U_02585 [Myxococcales bacterium]